MRYFPFLFFSFFGTIDLFFKSGFTTTLKEEQYTIQDIVVDIQDNSAAQARIKAVIQGQRLALQQLMNRLAPTLEKRASHDQHIAALSEDQLEKLVQDFEIQQEKNSPLRYKGVFTFRFKPNKIEEFLASQNIKPQAISLSNAPLLIIPLINNQSQENMLWQDHNPWRQGWENASLPSNYTLPIGDLQDLSTLTFQEAKEGKLKSLQVLMNRYQVKYVLITSLRASRGELDLYLYTFKGLEGMKESIPLSSPKSADISPEIFQEALAKTLQYIKDQGNLRPSQMTSLEGIVSFSNFKMWRRIQEKLSYMRLLRHHSLEILNSDRAVIKFTFAGNKETFMNELNHHGFSVERDAQHPSRLLLTLREIEKVS